MMKQVYLNIVIVVLVVLAVAGGAFYFKNRLLEPIACTLEAKICPDGSAVGRTGPNCEFATCPTGSTSGEATSTFPQKNSGTVAGKVTLSPVCPVERIPPDPNCAPKPYETKITVSSADGSKIIKTTQSNADGTFSFTLAPGNYTIQAPGGEMIYPRCSPIMVSIKTSATVQADISCDTGIR